MGFYARLKSYFGADYDGRYLAVILTETIRYQPEALRAIFPAAPKEWTRGIATGVIAPTIEWRFPGVKGMRRADIALLRHGRPIAIAEIKIDDIGLPSGSAQLKDYRKFCADNPDVSFAFVTKFLPTEGELKILECGWRESNIAPIRGHDLERKLKQLGLQNDPCVRMLLNYLEEIGMTGYKPIEIDNVTTRLFMRTLLPMKHSDGGGKSYSHTRMSSLPQFLNDTFRNLRYFSGCLMMKYPGLFAQDMKVFFQPSPYFNLSKLKNSVIKSSGANSVESYLDSETAGCLGGKLEVWTRGKIGSDVPNRYAYFQFGYGLEYEIGRSKTVDGLNRRYIFAEYFGNYLGRDAESSRIEKTLNLRQNEAVIRGKLAEVIKESSQIAAKIQVSHKNRKAAESLAVLSKVEF